MEKNTNVVKKNTDLDKENKRNIMALVESEYEKNEIRKENKEISQSLDTVLKENTVLNEHLQVKENTIKALKELIDEMKSKDGKENADESNVENGNDDSRAKKKTPSNEELSGENE